MGKRGAQLKTYTRHLAHVCVLAILFACAGCETVKVVAESKPYDAQCKADCFIKCPPLPKWDGTREHGDRLLAIDGDMNNICEARRALCAACLTALKEAAVIFWK